VIIFILKLRVSFCLIFDDFGRLLNLGWFNHRQVLALIPRNGLIILCVLLFGLIDALLDLFHLLIVCLLRLLPFVVLLHGLDSVSSSDTSVLVKVFALRIIRKLVLSGLLYNLFFGSFLGPKIISSNRSRPCPFGRFFFLWRFIEHFGVGGIIEDLLILRIVFTLPLLLFFLPNTYCLPAADLNGPYLISRHILEQFDRSLLDGNSILVDLLSNQTESIASL
jgi:hypothetical protein